MFMSATEQGPVSATTQWLHGLWVYYREYTHTAIHAASAAALTAFGLLVFIDGLFVVLAIAAYIFPPIILYSVDAEVGKPPDSSSAVTVRADSETKSNSDSDTNSDNDDGDTDSDGPDGDADADG